MTERQIRLKDEIIKISDKLQLGIYKDDPDWFYKFVQRMTLGEVIDSARTITGWNKVSTWMTLTDDFIQEFNNNINIEECYFSGNKEITVEYILERCNSQITYLCGYSYLAVMVAAKDERLTNDLVLKYEKLFDQTYGRLGGNAIPSYKETAWLNISNNLSITGSAKHMAEIKPHYN